MIKFSKIFHLKGLNSRPYLKKSSPVLFRQKKNLLVANDILENSEIQLLTKLENLLLSRAFFYRLINIPSNILIYLSVRNKNISNTLIYFTIDVEPKHS